MTVALASAGPPADRACACDACEASDCGCGCTCAELAIGLPSGFYDQVVASDLEQVVSLAFPPGGLVYLCEKAGRVRILQPDGTLAAAPLLDISEEVGNWGDHGLLSAALDPQFASNGYLYLLYVVDHHHAKFFGTPQYDPLANEFNVDTIGRITRYTVDVAGGSTSVLPDSRLVLLGESLTTGLPITSTSHGVGSLHFGDDGTLLVSMGDGTAVTTGDTALSEGIIQPKEDLPVGFRAQLVDSHNGKILRLDPATGDGLPSNPFFDPTAPRAPRSRVWMLGLRNPCRFAVLAGSGSPFRAAGDPGLLAIGDVGAGHAEELSLARDGGANFGWPLYEGLDPSGSGTNLHENPDAPNPLFGIHGCDMPYLHFEDLLVEDSLLPPSWPNPCAPAFPITGTPVFVHHRPALDWLHEGEHARVPVYDGGGAAALLEIGDPGAGVEGDTFGGNCSIGGAWYPGGSFPDEYDGVLFHADYGAGWIRVLRFDGSDRLASVEPFAVAAGKLTWVDVAPSDGSLWYIDYKLTGKAQLHHVQYSADNLPPTAVAVADPPYGNSPLDVVFDGLGSDDPEELPLDVRWDFSDGTPWSPLPHVTRNLPSEDVTQLGEPIFFVDGLFPPGSMGFSNPDPEVVRDGVRPPLGSLDVALQYDTIHFGPGGESDKHGLDWFGYAFPRTRTFTGILFQEGFNYTGGGWFATLEIQVRRHGQWTDVADWTCEPPYPGDLLAYFETFEFRFPPVDGDAIRLYGAPGGIGTLAFTTVAELRVMARPEGPLPPHAVSASLTVTDAAGALDVAATSVVLDDTPPYVHVQSPRTGDVYELGQPTPIACLAQRADAESSDGELGCTWQVILHHDNHTHPQPELEGCEPTTELLPEGDCSSGDVFWQEVRCTVTDPLGLEDVDSVFVVPACDRNLNAVDDALDIANGTSRDVDADGIPDECQRDCNGNGVGDFYDVFFGTSADADGDGRPDECDGVTIEKDGKPAPGAPGPAH